MTFHRQTGLRRALSLCLLALVLVAAHAPLIGAHLRPSSSCGMKCCRSKSSRCCRTESSKAATQPAFAARFCPSGCAQLALVPPITVLAPPPAPTGLDPLFAWSAPPQRAAHVILTLSRFALFGRPPPGLPLAAR